MENTLNFQIEKGIPIPKVARDGIFHVALLTAFAQMKVGDSFAYRDETKTGSKATTIRNRAKESGVKVVIRKIAENQYRVWKTE